MYSELKKTGALLSHGSNQRLALNIQRVRCKTYRTSNGMNVEYWTGEDTRFLCLSSFLHHFYLREMQKNVQRIQTQVTIVGF
jgi:hypothetical protein